MKWQGYDWQVGERWGLMHPEKTECWYDKSAVKIIDDELYLKTHYNPKKIDGVISPFGVGLINCTTKFKHGRFDIDIKLPKGPSLWPAFWMWAFESWPPEIDVFEAYSNHKGSYFNWNINALLGDFWKVQTNVHLGKSPDNYMIGAKEHWLGWKCPSKDFHTYSVEWFPHGIFIYFDNKLVREILDENILSQLNDKTMNVVINNSIKKEHNIPENKTVVSTMICKNFRYSEYYGD
jgi:beta-glucanase (GH16 family)